MQTGVIYRIYNRINGKSYIGVTTQPITERIRQHFKKSSGCVLLKNAITKYGQDSFVHEVIEVNVTQDNFRTRENFWIDCHNSMLPHGYNLKEGGGGTMGYDVSEETKNKRSMANKNQVPWMKGRKHSEETRKKISEANKGRVLWSKGKPLSEETRKKMSESHKGRRHTDESKQKMSESRKGKPSWRKGKFLSEEHKKNISKSHKGKHGRSHTEETKRKISHANKGKRRTDNEKRKVSEGLKRYWKEKKERENGTDSDAVH